MLRLHRSCVAPYSLFNLPRQNLTSLRGACPQAIVSNGAAHFSSSVFGENDKGKRPLRIALCGAGTVGGGVCEIMLSRGAVLESMGYWIEIKKILVKDIAKERDFDAPAGVQYVTDLNEILNDDEVDCVVEMIGGVTTAKDIVFGAIQKGKHVVTANKALVAAHMSEIDALLEDQPQVRFGFEASVCGGIPIIHGLQRTFASDSINRIAGVFNGTTNFILSKMELEGKQYHDVLTEAQALGFAEADPTADVGGYDARSKLCILARLALGVQLDESKVSLQGMEMITADDFIYAKKLNCSIKLLGVVEASEGKVTCAAVSPMLVPQENTIAKVHGATNIVEILSSSLQRSFLIGEGAGRLPTANSIMADLTQISACDMPKMPFLLRQDLEVCDDFDGQFYIRIRVKDELGIIRKAGELCEKHGISVHAIYQEPWKDPTNMPFVLTTETTAHSNVEALCADLDQEPFTVVKTFHMPFLAQ